MRTKTCFPCLENVMPDSEWYPGDVIQIVEQGLECEYCLTPDDIAEIAAEMKFDMMREG